MRPRIAMFSVLACAALAAACSGDSSTTPTPPAGGGGPQISAPAEGEQMTSLRPALRVTNASGGSGARTYEFQISDRSDFAASTGSSYYAVALTRTGVAEATGGTTTFTPDTDLQPATRFYWRVRVSQGGTSGDWSAARSFKSQIVGYNRPGELYDPLVNGETVGVRSGPTTFAGSQGIRIESQRAYVVYQLPQTIGPAGEFSVEVQGLAPNKPGAKLKIFSMADDPGNLVTSDHLMNVHYRGAPGNPDNCIAFKALFGSETFKLEPDLNERRANVVLLDPNRVYHWKATWGSEFRLIVEDGGIGGPLIYNHAEFAGGGIYAPSPEHYAFLGANVFPSEEEEGSYPGATIKNVWISTKPRPASLGSALR